MFRASSFLLCDGCRAGWGAFCQEQGRREAFFFLAHKSHLRSKPAASFSLQSADKQFVSQHKHECTHTHTHIYVTSAFLKYSTKTLEPRISSSPRSSSTSSIISLTSQQGSGAPASSRYDTFVPQVGNVSVAMPTLESSLHYTHTQTYNLVFLGILCTSNCHSNVNIEQRA